METTFVIRASALAFKRDLADLAGDFCDVRDGSITLLPFQEGCPWDGELHWVPPEEALPGDIRIAGTTAILRSEPTEDWSGTILAVDHVKRGPLYVAIGFRWLQLDDKLKVSITCLEEAAKPLFERLLDEITKLWPESGLADKKEQKAAQDTSLNQTEKVPKRRKHFNRWVAIWWMVSDAVAKGYDVRTIHRRHKGMCGYDLLCKIVEAGRQGLLDRKV